MKCKYCNKETNLFFCPICGKIIEYPHFIKGNIEQEKELDKFVANLVKEANDKQMEITRYVDESLLKEQLSRIYFERIAFLQEFCNQKAIKRYFEKNGESSFENFEKFGHLCMTNECQIAILGTVKAGKSMFINSILGREVASSYPTPETASLTKFRYSPQRDYVKVSFYTDKEWKELWDSVMEAKENSYRDDKEDFLSEYSKHNAEELKPQLLNKKDVIIYPKNFAELKDVVSRYTSAQYAEHFFAKEVEIGLTEFNVPKDVVFVDTPGLNDPVKFRSDVTKRYINSANVIILCISAEKATIDSKELKQIAMIFSALRYAKERLYIVGTKYDMPSDNFINFWEKHTKPQFVKILSGKYYYGDVDIAENKISPISAWYYILTQNALVDKDIWNNEDSLKSIDIMLSKCLDFSRNEQLKSIHGDGIKGLMGRFRDSVAEIIQKSNATQVVRMLKIL